MSVVAMKWPTHWSRSDDLTFSIYCNIRPTQGLRNENIWFAFSQLWLGCREALKAFDSSLLELAWHRKRNEPNLNINQIRWYIPKLLFTTQRRAKKQAISIPMARCTSGPSSHMAHFYIWRLTAERTPSHSMREQSPSIRLLTAWQHTDIYRNYCTYIYTYTHIHII